MSQVGIVEAARLAGKDRKTIYRDIKSGRLSATIGPSGTRQVDTAELMRVYGDLHHTGPGGKDGATPRAETTEAPDQTTELRLRLAAAEAELEQLRLRLVEKDGHISDLRGTVRLLAGPKQERPWWKIW